MCNIMSEYDSIETVVGRRGKYYINDSLGTTSVMPYLAEQQGVSVWFLSVTVAWVNGQPERIIFPTDSKGRLCGVHNAVK